MHRLWPQSRHPQSTRQPRRIGQIISMTMLALVCFSGLMRDVALAQDGGPVGARPSDPPKSESAGEPIEAVDLAALLVRPSEIGGAFRVVYGYVNSLAYEAGAFADFYDLDPDEMAAMLERFGWQSKAGLFLAYPTEEDESQYEYSVETTITSFPTGEDARAAYRFLQDESFLASVAPVTDLLAADAFGRPAEITAYQDRRTDTGELYLGLNLTFQVGHLLANVYFNNYAGGQPDKDFLEQVGLTLKAKLEQRNESNQPFRGVLVQRLAEDENVRDFYDYYAMIDGHRDRFFYESVQEARARRRDFSDAIDVYLVEQWVANRAYHVAYLTRFDGEASAAAFLRQLPDIVEGGVYGNVESMGEAPVIGDEAAAVSYTVAFDDGSTVTGYHVAVRIGADILSVQVDADPAPPLDVVVELAESWAACYAARDCTERIALPPRFAEYIAGLSEE
jgi:hypothetical protein